MGKQKRTRNIDRRSFIKYSLGVGGGMLLGSNIVGFLRPVGAANPGESVKIEYSVTADRMDMTELTRMVALSLKEAGIEVKIKTLEFGAWLGNTIGEHKSHMSHLVWTGSPERIDPSFFLTEFFHSKYTNKGGRNYEHYRNPEYDKICDAANAEMNEEKRVKLVHKCQEILAKDYPLWPVGFGSRPRAYNSDAWDGPVAVMGGQLGGGNDHWTWLNLKPKTQRTKVITCGSYAFTNFSLSARSGDVRGFMRLIYDTFLKLDPENKVIPWAAKSWRVVNNTTVDIELRDGMRFHDGKPVTIEDVKFTFDYMKDKQLGMYQSVYNSIEKTEILDRNNFRFHLVRPYAPFITSALVYAHILPKHIWEKIDDPQKYPNENPMGSGPFKFGHLRRDNHELYLEANKDHFNPPNIDGLYRKVILTMEATIGALENKEVDFHELTLSSEQVEYLSKYSHLKFETTLDHGPYEIRGDLERRPFNDIAFRQAVSYLIPRRDFISLMFEDIGFPAANSLIHPKSRPWYNTKVPFDEYSLDKAKAILKKAGYTWDRKKLLHYPG
jgi:peptide/nickel transport system substrate-binding protein